MLGIIGGSGMAVLDELEGRRRQVVRTPYGDPSCPFTFGRLAGQEIVFLARHGFGHTIAPHQINYRANLWALDEVGVKRIVSVATVGGIRADLSPGTLLVPDQIIDYTHGRSATFYEGPDQPVTHIDFTEPYDAGLRAQLLAAASSAVEVVLDGGTYGVTQGPRLETAAEIRRLEGDGCDVVGMTAMPEAALARELGIRYVSLAAVANYAAGKGDSVQAISLDAINGVLAVAMRRVQAVLRALR